MCLINFHWQDHDHYRLIVAANRDEAYERPTAAAHFWQDHPFLLAGRDLLQHGTWLGITKGGRFAALTNYRDPSITNKDLKSRGELVTNYLTSDMNPRDYLDIVHQENGHYAGFNLLVGSMSTLYYYNNIEQTITHVSPGTHGLSNRFLNTPWPKVVNGKQNLRSHVLGKRSIKPQALFDLLSDTEQALDDDLPETGIGLTLEKQLSPLFIQTPTYGTRSSTVLLIDRNNHVTFIERTYDKGNFSTETNFNFTIKKA